MSERNDATRPAAGRERSMRGEFTAKIGEDGAVHLPEELLARLRLHGVDRIEVTVEPAGAGRDILASRGIDDAAVERVAQVQHLPTVVAESMLLAEGGALDHPALASRLLLLSSSQS